MTVAASPRRPSAAVVCFRRAKLVGETAVEIVQVLVMFGMLLTFAAIPLYVLGAVAAAIVGGGLEWVVRSAGGDDAVGPPIRVAVGVCVAVGTGVVWFRSTWKNASPSRGEGPVDRFRREWREAAEPAEAATERIARLVQAAMAGVPAAAGASDADVRSRTPARSAGSAPASTRATGASTPRPSPPPPPPVRRPPVRQPRPTEPAAGDATITFERSVEPLTAWRMWRVGSVEPSGWFGSEPDPILGSVAVGHIWAARVEVAACRLRDHGTRRVPDLTCRCGIYALKRPARMLAYERYGLVVAGPVLLRGRVLEGDVGYRAEIAEIVGPLRVRLSCAAGLLHRSFPAACGGPIETVTVTDAAWLPHCFRHVEQYPDPGLLRVPGRRTLLPRGSLDVATALACIQARFEIRYGIEVTIDEGETWT